MRNNENHKYLVKHKSGSYQVQIWHNSKHNYIGLYPTIEEAIIARDIFLKKNSHMNTSSTYVLRIRHGQVIVPKNYSKHSMPRQFRSIGDHARLRWISIAKPFSTGMTSLIWISSLNA